jgi:hypothetical protein
MNFPSKTEAWNRKQIAQVLTNTTTVLINKNSWTLAAMLDGWKVVVGVVVVVWCGIAMRFGICSKYCINKS